MNTILRLGALVAVLALTSACNPVFHASEAELAEVRAIAEANQAPDSSAASAAAQAAAEQAQAAAEAALAAVQDLRGEIDATNQRIDRMFEESQAK